MTVASLPHLSQEDRAALADYVNRADVQAALAELTSACACIAGAIFCTCEARLTLTKQQQELVEPLTLAYAAGVQLTAS